LAKAWSRLNHGFESRWSHHRSQRGLPGIPEVDLGLVARGDLDAHRGPDLGRGEAMEEALERGVAAGEHVLLDEELPDGLPFDALVTPALDGLPERLDEGLLVWRPRGRGGLQGLRQGRGVRQRSLQPPVLAAVR